ncbi:MAG: hypothetical protein JXB50_02985 [Spirochaetes bacterium]|nr:hypothetical protein [Spirochaetota bacterium]
MTNILIILFGLTMLHVFSTTRIEAYIKTLTLQGFLLFLMILLEIKKLLLINFIYLGIETLIFKTIIIPIFLFNVVRKNEIKREVEPYISHLYSLIIASLIFVFGFVISLWLLKIENEIKHLYFGISISMIISGLFLIITRKKIITHILCYMMIENGIFLLSLSIAKEMPLLVNLGILLDIFVGIYLFLLFFNKIQTAYDQDHIDVLTGLKD